MNRVSQLMTDEPLIPFALIGGVLFIAFGFSRAGEEVETIEVRPSTIRALEAAQQDLLGRPLTDRERQDVREGYIEDEILLREAFKMDLEKNDTRVRKRLLDVMRSTIDQPIAAPTRPELEAYFRENQDRYAAKETVSFDHVYFLFGSELEPPDTAKVLATLRGGVDHTQLGDGATFGRIIRDRSREQLRRVFGADFAEAAFSVSSGRWQGPFESSAGIHFLRVTEKGVTPPPTFEQLEEYLRQDWTFRRRRKIQSDKIAEWGERYRIVIAEDR